MKAMVLSDHDIKGHCNNVSQDAATDTCTSLISVGVLDQYDPVYRNNRVPQITNHFLGFSVLFLNIKLLFCPLFSQEVRVSFSYKMVSYLLDSTVQQ